MGTYSGFLLLEDLFDDLPPDSSTLYNESQQLFTPTVNVIEVDCGTNLGESITLDFTQIGQYDLALDRRLTYEDITFFLSEGQYSRFVRNPPHCISDSGICQKCYIAVNPGLNVPSPGTTVKLNSYLTVATQYVILSVGNNSFVLDSDDADFTRIDAYFNDGYTQNYTLVGLADGTIQLTYNGVFNSGDTLFIRMYNDTSSPFMSYLSATYAGNLLGAAYLETGDLPARASLLKERITDSRLSTLEKALQPYSTYIPEGYMNYIANIKDPLERELYILALYGVFYDVGV